MITGTLADERALKSEIKRKLLIERLELEDVTEEEIADDMILFEEGLGLDSVEAFEVMVGLEELYGVTLKDVPAKEVRHHLETVNAIAALIRAKRAGTEV
jgi:Acyl carrier protein